MIKEFENLILKKKVSEINKITLKKIFYLINFVLEINEEIPKERKNMEKKIEEFISSTIFKNKINEIDNDQTKKSIINIRIRSIIQTQNLEECISRNIKEKYSVYKYSKKTIIYIKNKELKKEEIKSEIINCENIFLISKDKKKRVKLSNFLKGNVNIGDYDKIVLKSTTL
jgi:hypothetical protein